MTEQKERYLHFVCCIDWLNECWQLLKTIQAEADNPLRGAAFRFALVLYCKPYGKSRGSASKPFKLDKSRIPNCWASLHDRIISSRDQIQAHTDLNVIAGEVHIHEFMGERYSTISQNMISGTEELKNIDEIIALVEGTLDAMYVEEKMLLAAIENPPSSPGDLAPCPRN